MNLAGTTIALLQNRVDLLLPSTPAGVKLAGSIFVSLPMNRLIAKMHLPSCFLVVTFTAVLSHISLTGRVIMKLLGASAIVASLSFVLWLAIGVSQSAAATTPAGSTTPPTTQPSGKKLNKDHKDEEIEHLRAEHRALKAKLAELRGEKKSGKSAPKAETQTKEKAKPAVEEKLTREETIAKLHAENTRLREEIAKLEAKKKK